MSRQKNNKKFATDATTSRRVIIVPPMNSSPYQIQAIRANHLIFTGKMKNSMSWKLGNRKANARKTEPPKNAFEAGICGTKNEAAIVAR